MKSLLSWLFALVSVGFLSPKDYIEGRIDLNRELIKHPIVTFYLRVTGDSMRDARIDEGGLLVVDSAAETNDGDIVVARVGNDLTIKRLCIENCGRIWLCPENPAYQPIAIMEECDFEVWGRVMYSIQKH